MSNLPILIVMVGIPGSGKSYKAKELSELYNAKVFSSDEYRKILLGDSSNQSNNKLVFERLYDDIEKCLTDGCNAILDSTNTTYKSRKTVIDRFKDISNIEAFVMTTKIEECIFRDANRERTVGEDVVRKFISYYQFPQMFEGFSSITIDNVSNNCYNKMYATNVKKLMDSFDQKNKHHKYTLGKHCSLLAEQFNTYDIRYLSGLWHDVGKFLTQSIDESGQAHYYNHDSYSTYYMLSNLDLVDIVDNYSICEFLFYINYHMKIRDLIKSAKESTVEKYRNLFGTDLTGSSRYDKLVEFMNADNKASGREND